jgi:transcriptional accessory protein Tex/SPT6
MPSIRSFVRAEFVKHVRIHTAPTEKGKNTLDIFHPLYRAKHLGKGKSLSSFDDELWIYIDKAEVLGLIEVNFALPWSDVESNTTIGSLKELYLSEEVDEVAVEWNALRLEVLRSTVDTLHLEFQKAIRSELRINAEHLVAEKCGRVFDRLLSTVPLRTNEEDETRPRVLAFITDPE